MPRPTLRATLYGAVDCEADDQLDSLRVFMREQDRDDWITAREGFERAAGSLDWQTWQPITLHAIDSGMARQMIREELDAA